MFKGIYISTLLYFTTWPIGHRPIGLELLDLAEELRQLLLLAADQGVPQAVVVRLASKTPKRSKTDIF